MTSNPPLKPYVVMKFGGTSIGKFLEVIASEIIPSVPSSVPPLFRS